MMKTSEAKIKHFDGEDYTCTTFQPDLSKFKMRMTGDIRVLMTRRAYDHWFLQQIQYVQCKKEWFCVSVLK